MFRRHPRWAAIACLASWAVGPAIGTGLAAHELEHHDLEGHSHAARAAEAFLHGHLHEAGAEDHVHELMPPSFMPSRLAQASQAADVAAISAGSPEYAAGLRRSYGPPPEPTGLAPPDSFALCVLRL